jgi:hypothetical protein
MQWKSETTINQQKELVYCFPFLSSIQTNICMPTFIWHMQDKTHNRKIKGHNMLNNQYKNIIAAIEVQYKKQYTT